MYVCTYYTKSKLPILLFLMCVFIHVYEHIRKRLEGNIEKGER